MNKAEAVTQYLERGPERMEAYQAARTVRPNVSIVLPQRLVPVMLIALEHLYSAYEFGPDAGRDKAEAEGMLKASLTPSQADALAVLMGSIQDFRAAYKDADA